MVFSIIFNIILYFLKTIPWWAPILLIWIGLISHATVDLDIWLTNHFIAWDGADNSLIIGVLAACATGSITLGLVSLRQIGIFIGSTDSEWIFAMLILVFARGIEGALSIWIIIHRIQQVRTILYGTQGSASLIKSLKIIYLFLQKRFIKVILYLVVWSVGILTFVGSLQVYPDANVLFRATLAWSLITFGTSVTGAWWYLFRANATFRTGTVIGVVFTVAGGELYNVPTSVQLFASKSLQGPLSSTVPKTAAIIGFSTGVVIMYLKIIQRTAKND